MLFLTKHGVQAVRASEMPTNGKKRKTCNRHGKKRGVDAVVGMNLKTSLLHGIIRYEPNSMSSICFPRLCYSRDKVAPLI